MIGISEYKKQLSNYKLGVFSCILDICLHSDTVYCYFECSLNSFVSKNFDNMSHNLQCRNAYKCSKDLSYCFGIDGCRCDIFDKILSEVSEK